MLDNYKREPDFVNDEGTKWWQSGKWRGRYIFHVELINGERTIVVLDKDGSFLASDNSLDALCFKIDAIALANDEDMSERF